MSRRIHRDCLLTICLSLFTLASVWADTVERTEPQVDSAVATDAPPARTITDVAREVVRLQQEMGGSVVQDWNTMPVQVEPTQRAIYQPQVEQPTLPAVRILRDSARQLEQSAHQLESLDLYQEADLLREMAARVRGNARKLRAESPGIPPVNAPLKRS